MPRNCLPRRIDIPHHQRFVGSLGGRSSKTFANFGFAPNIAVIDHCGRMIPVTSLVWIPGKFRGTPRLLLPHEQTFERTAQSVEKWQNPTFGCALRALCSAVDPRFDQLAK
jgi:hypothetical protein